MALKQHYRGGNFFPPLRKETEIDVRPLAQGDDDIEIKDCIKALKLQVHQMNSKLQSLENMVYEKCDKNSKDISKTLSVFSEALQKVDKRFKDVQDLATNLEEKIKGADLKVEKAEDLADKLQNELAMVKYRTMQKALRLRGIPERPKENLKQICSKSLAKLMEIKEEKITCKILKIYRVNSWIAKQKCLPRDIVIYFTELKMRNDIASRCFSSKMYVEGRQIKIFKEIPPRILRLRKDFRFLADELKKRAVLFRWDAPMGMSFKYSDQYHKMDTIEKAKAFYLDVLKAAKNPSSSRHSSEPIQEKNLELNLEFLQELEAKTAGQETQSPISEAEEFTDETQSGASDDEEFSDETQPVPVRDEELYREFLFKVKSALEASNAQFGTVIKSLE